MDTDESFVALLNSDGENDNAEDILLTDFEIPDHLFDNLNNAFGDFNDLLFDPDLFGDDDVRDETSRENENPSDIYVNDPLSNPVFGNDNVRDETSRENANLSNNHDNHPLSDPVSGNNSLRDETSRENENRPDAEVIYSCFGKPKNILYPIPPVPYSCTCCQVLREITHTNGNHFLKLEIHGRVGLISHAILQSQYADTNGGPVQYQLLDFCKKSLETVRDLLVKYCEDRREAGYSMLQDPLRPFYEALIAGIHNWQDDISFDEDIGNGTSAPPSSSRANEINQLQSENQVTPETGSSSRPPRSALSLQRERTKKLTLKDFKCCFDCKAKVAAKKMRVCNTVLKKICRRHGLARWPYRTITSIKKGISENEKILNSRYGEERRNVEEKLEELQRSLSAQLAAFDHEALY